MQRPSNLIIAFTMAIFAVFGTYALSRIMFRALESPAIEPDLEQSLLER